MNSLTESAKPKDLNPQHYLTDVLGHIAHPPGTSTNFSLGIHAWWQAVAERTIGVWVNSAPMRRKLYV